MLGNSDIHGALNGALEQKKWPGWAGEGTGKAGNMQYKL